MPLVDDQTRGTDRRSTSPWPWILVVAGLALLWIVVSVGISLISRSAAPRPPATPTAVVQEMNGQFLRQAQMAHSYQQWADAAQLLQSVRDDAPMSVSDKHTYFRVGGESLVKSGSPLAGAKYYERFLSMGTQIHTQECRSCHHASGASIPPARLADLRTSSLGSAYASALKKAGKLQATRDALRVKWERNPEDPRLNLLLHHLETARGRRTAAAEHGKALQDWDSRQIAAAGP